jgi:predicted lactoylglutathione lyase
MMSEIKTLHGTIQIIEKDIQIPKKNGGTYPGSRLTFLGPNGTQSNQAFHQVGLSKNAELAADINALEVGDDVIFTYSLNDRGFRDFKSIKKSDGTIPVEATTTSTSTKKSVNNDYTTGAIKGNSVTNAVNIAISNGDTSLEALKSAYDLVIQLHAYAEEQGITPKEEVEAPAPVAKPTLDGDVF